MTHNKRWVIAKPITQQALEALAVVPPILRQVLFNRGIGTVNLPIRLNCPPEITLFTLRRG